MFNVGMTISVLTQRCAQVLFESFLYWVHSFWSLVYISFAIFRSKQMFDFLKEKNWEWHCDMIRSRVRCDEIGILRISLRLNSLPALLYSHPSILVDRLSTFHAYFQSKQILEFLKETNWEWHCDMLRFRVRCNEIGPLRFSLPALLFILIPPFFLIACFHFRHAANKCNC